MNKPVVMHKFARNINGTVSIFARYFKVSFKSNRFVAFHILIQAK